MAEFCVDCLNQSMGTHYPTSKFIVSKDLDFCEGCMQWKPVVIAFRRDNNQRTFNYATHPLETSYLILKVLWKICKTPFVLYKQHKSKTKKRVRNRSKPQ